MRTNSSRVGKQLFLGVLPVLLFASFSLENPRTQTQTTVTVPNPPDPLLYLQPGIFHPLTEEYVRQQAKELPYEVTEGVLFERYSPLELALLPEEEFPLRKKKGKATLLGNPDVKGGWKPLTQDEREARERELATKAVEMGMELADSLSIPSFADGILWTTRRFNTYQHHLAEQYRLHFKVSGDDATVTYQVKY